LRVLEHGLLRGLPGMTPGPICFWVTPRLKEPGVVPAFERGWPPVFFGLPNITEIGFIAPWWGTSPWKAEEPALLLSLSSDSDLSVGR